MSDDAFQEGPENFVLTEPAQLRALGAPASRAVFQGLLQLGQGSIKEVASLIGKTPHALYHHMEKLVAVGLVLEAGERRSGARVEKLYRPVAHLLSTDPSNHDADYLSAVADNAAAGYRQAERELRRTLVSGEAHIGTDKKNALALQFAVPLTDQQRKELVGRIEQLVEDFTSGLEMDENGEIHLVTLGLSPEAKK